MSDVNQLQVYDDLSRAVSTFSTFEEGLQTVAKADMIRIMSKKAKRSLEEQNRFAEIKLRAERRMGKMLQTMEKNKGGGDMTVAKEHRSTDVTGEETATLAELGVTKNQSSNWQRIATVPEQEFEAWVQEKKKENAEITEKELVNVVKKTIRAEEIAETEKEIEAGIRGVKGKFDVITIDPPWSYDKKAYDTQGQRGVVPYPTMTYEELKKITIPAEEDCVLWLWTTHAFIWEAKQLLDDWGFTYKAILVWDKEKMGLGRNLRMQCEFCLLATKGTPALKTGDARDIIREARREHSRKPLAFYEMVEKLCIGRKLDYFAREARQGWEVYGAETKKFTGEKNE